MGIEPTSSAWKAEVLPLNYTRNGDGAFHPLVRTSVQCLYARCLGPSLVEGGGFEPPKAEPSDLQSDPFGHSGTPPKCKPRILQAITDRVKKRSGRIKSLSSPWG
jgi:hypothetical protein